MAHDPFQHERVLPCLLLRLKAGAANQQTIRDYRKSVKDDLYALLNTSRPSLEEVCEKYPRIAKSVLNFGFRSLGGKVSNSLEIREVQRDMNETLANFEPRIDPESVDISAVKRNFGDPTSEFEFQIDGELWAQPVEHLGLRTRVDLETGDIGVEEDRSR